MAGDSWTGYYRQFGFVQLVKLTGVVCCHWWDGSNGAFKVHAVAQAADEKQSKFPATDAHMLALVGACT